MGDIKKAVDKAGELSGHDREIGLEKAGAAKDFQLPDEEAAQLSSPPLHITRRQSVDQSSMRIEQGPVELSA